MARSKAVAPVVPTGQAHGAPLRIEGLTAGIYELTAADYHADPAPKPSLSSHVAAVLLDKSPRHAWLAHPRLNPNFINDNDPKFDLGRSAHLLMLEGAAPFEIIDAPNWKSEAARDERQAVARAGKIALLEHEWARVSAMVKSARAQLRQTDEAYNAFRDGEGERTLIWQEGSIWCRARLDWLQRKRRYIFDYKTTTGSSAPRAWVNRQLYDIGGDVQASFYLRGATKLLGGDWQFRFVVQEQDPPYALSVVGLSPEQLDLAAIDVSYAIDAWTTCQRRQKWPGYSTRTYYGDAPAWKKYESEARITQAQLDRQAKVDPYRLSIQLWQP
jgi:PDDEXK-like domain of unknown function (DUF3799)